MGPLFNSGHGMVTATLTETVNMPGYVVPSEKNTMVVFPDKSSVPADGSPINVNVRAGGAYTVTMSATWAHYQKYEHGLTIFADPNADNEREFTATITLDADTAQTVTLNLTQSSISDTGFSIAPGMNVVSAFGSNGESIQLNASGRWNAETLNDWMLVYDTEDKLHYVGYNSEALVVRAKPNYTGVVRKGFVRFYGSNGEAKYTVMQNPVPFSVSAESITFDQAGGTQSLTLKPTLGDTLPDITVSSTVEGITASYANGVVTVTATANNTDTAREGHINIAASAVDVAVVSLTQPGA